MKNQEIIEFGKAHHSEMVEKGFWKDKSQVKKALLICSELSEALEAHRKGKRCNIAITIFEGKDFSNELIYSKFEKDVKDKVEDEVADSTLRLLDYSAYFEDLGFLKQPENVIKSVESVVLVSIDEIMNNWECTLLDALLFKANSYMLKFETLKTYICLLLIAKELNFDLWAHVKAKRLYNQQRPYLFGKKY